ncbi:putative 2OG-Fe(II) oxygenase [Parvularcula marina]|uniref:putative 2OG-Fe(II) oxygenase n=1 Tax=Parvularcula marina TaxID=2292771 RepID=UPI0035190F6D
MRDEELEAMDNATISGLLNQAAASLKGANPALALQLTDQIIASRTDVGPAHYLRGAAKTMLGDGAAAEAAFRQALKLAPDIIPARIALAKLLDQSGRSHDAVRLVGEHPDAPMPDLLFLSAEIRLRLGEFEAAEADCERLISIAPADARARVLRGRVYIDAHKYAQAEEILSDAAEKAPNSPTAFFYLARARTQQGKTRAAREALKKAAALRPNAPSILQEQARAAYSDGDTEAALGFLEHAIKFEPRNPNLHRDLSQIRFMKGDDDHLRSFREVLANAPYDIGILSVYAGAARAGKDPQTALPQLDAAINAGVDHAYLWDARAQIHIMLDNISQGVADTDRAGTAPGIDHSTHLNRCSAYLSANLPEKALPLAEDLVRAAPLDQLALAYRLTAMCALDDPAAEEFINPDILTNQQAIDCPDGFDSLEDFNTALKARLLELHGAEREPIDQSLRGGTQTELFPLLEDDPLIGQLADMLLANVRRFADGLPRQDGHPFLGAIPEKFEFSGIWTVCLRDGGHHASHVHPEGWLSSAYYVSLPASARNSNSGEGALNIGRPPMKALHEKLPGRLVPPREGYLTLFPSYLWHGTEPFHSEEPRITVAFDIAPRR